MSSEAIAESLRILDKRAAAAALKGDTETMLNAFLAMKDIESQLKLDGHCAKTCMNVANTLIMMKRLDEALSASKEAAEAFARCRDRKGEAKANLLSGNILAMNSDFVGAKRIAEKESGSSDWTTKGEAHMLFYRIYALEGSREKAQDHIGRAIRCFDASGGGDSIKIALKERARFYASISRPDLAAVDEARVRGMEDGRSLLM